MVNRLIALVKSYLSLLFLKKGPVLLLKVEIPETLINWICILPYTFKPFPLTFCIVWELDKVVL